MADLFAAAYNPDVLTCLANLSNDEVFTPPELANQVLDMLPNELWSDASATFLDPCCKSGVFLREIAKRLIVGLADQIPDLQERVDHIFQKQLFGIAITELTSLLSRRSLYCSKWPNGKYSVTRFESAEGNLRFRECQHTWVNRRCSFCGASKKELGDGREGLETHAYEFIHLKNPEELFNMKFDVIVGNPPYQLSDGGNESSATPIYNRFIEQAKRLNPRYLIMIVPSRWMQGGKGLSSFRSTMMDDEHISILVDYENAASCFPSNVHIDGGICYFLYDRQHSGKMTHTFHTKQGETIVTERFLRSSLSDVVIRDYREISILEKIKSSRGEYMSSIVSSRKPFGIAKDFFNSPQRYPNVLISDTPFDNCVRIFGVKGHKGGAKRTSAYVSREAASASTTIEKHKLFFTTSYSSGAVIPPEPILGYPNDICTETFLVIGPFDNEEQMRNCFDYVHTSFFRALLYFRRGSMQVTKSVFEYIPIQDFSKPWTDEELYAKYGLTDEEIAFIESMIKPMDLGDSNA